MIMTEDKGIGTLILYGALFVYLILSLYFIVIYIQRKWMLRKFNGPLAFPFIGNCYDPSMMNFMKYLCKLRRVYGRIFTVFGFSKAYLVVTEPVAVRRVLSDIKCFIKGSDYSDTFSMAFGEGLVTASGEKHKKDRAVFGKYFVKTNLSKYCEMINAECREGIVEKIESKLNAGERSLNMEKFFAVLALRCFCNFSMNTNLKHDTKQEDRLCKITSEASAACARLLILNLPSWKWLPQASKLALFVDEVSKTMLPIVDERRAAVARGECGELDDCLTAMIRENMPHKELVEHVCTLIGAGHDTTAYFSAYMAHVLAANPVVQEKLRQEINEKIGDKEIVTFEDISELKYMSSVMQETLRFYAIIPQVSRESTEEVVIKEANVTIPKGATILIPLFLMNRDPTLWENPSQFIPERFSEKPNEAFTSAKNGFFPFGYGSRTCIGNILAQMENGIFMCHLLRKYRFLPKPGFKLHIMSGISLTTNNGVYIDIERL